VKLGWRVRYGRGRGWGRGVSEGVGEGVSEGQLSCLRTYPLMERRCMRQGNMQVFLFSKGEDWIQGFCSVRG
jgi:hypothetical protein